MWRTCKVGDVPLRRSACALLCLLYAAPDGHGQDSQGGNLRRQQSYSGFWPFYSHETFEDGSEKWMSLGGLVRAEAMASGDTSHHVLPLYATSSVNAGSDTSLALFPLLYLHRRSPDTSYDIVLPLFGDWQSGPAHHTVLWPLFQAARDPEPAPFRLLPTLFRHGSWAEKEEDRQRFGVPLLLELFERSHDKARDAWRFLNFFNFSDETRAGLPLAGLTRSGDGSSHSHLFPLYFHTSEPGRSRFFTPLFGTWSVDEEERRGVAVPPLLSWGSTWKQGHDVNVLWPLVRAREEPDGWTARYLPFYEAGEDAASSRRHRFYSGFYGWVEDPSHEARDDYLPFLLSHWGSERDASSLDVLWPLGHYSENGEEDFALRALPFYARSLSKEEEFLDVGLWLYLRWENRAAQDVTQSILFPFILWESSPEAASAWAVPLFYHSASKSQTESSWTTLVVPSYFQSESEESHVDYRGHGTKLASSHLHVWPFFGIDRHTTTVMPSEDVPAQETTNRRWSTLFPFFQVTRHTHSQAPESPATTVDAPWPLLEYDAESSTDKSFRLFPLVFWGTMPSRDYFYLYPLVSVEEGKTAEDNIFHWTSLIQWYGGSDETRFHLLPFLFKYSEWGTDMWSMEALLYLFYVRSEPGSGWIHLLPLGGGRWKEDDLAFAIFPLYFQREHGREPIRYDNPARFFFLWNTLGSDTERHWSLLWKLAEHTSGANGDYDFRILHRFIVNRDVQGQRQFYFNPFVQYSADARTGESSLRILFIPVW